MLKRNEGIAEVGRYSFENYLLDPINLFCLLLENRTAPPVQGIQISAGNEHLLRLQSADALQAIVDVIVQMLEKAEPTIKTVTTSCVEYTVGMQVTVPSWVIDHRGHDLLPIAQRALGGPSIVSPPRLIRALRRGRLVPLELAVLLANIQQAL